MTVTVMQSVMDFLPTIVCITTTDAYFPHTELSLGGGAAGTTYYAVWNAGLKSAVANADSAGTSSASGSATTTSAASVVTAPGRSI
jgi:hypothetical protein